MKSKPLTYISLIGLLSLIPATANAIALDDEEAFSFTYENDVFHNTDRSYTSGVRLSWISGEEQLPKYIKPLANIILNPTAEYFPLFPKEHPDVKSKRRISYALGQSIFTPDDTTLRTPDPLDRPYAGWLYGSMGLTADREESLDFIELTVGMVGPSTLAEQTQDFVHRSITGSKIAQGWDHQLKDEPGVVLMYEHKWRNLYEAKPFGLGMDFTPQVGVSLGNIFTHAATGGTLRVGYDLPSDYGPPRVRPSISGTDYFKPTKNIGWYLFAGLEGRAVGRNIFLDGNTFRDSPSVDKKTWIGDFQYGLAITYQNARLSFTQVERSKEYETQDDGDSFGAVNLTFKF